MEYLIAFSSFYKAIYAQEKLQERQIRVTLKKLPPELIKSCGYALYLRTDSIQSALSILDAAGVVSKGVFLIDTSQGRTNYRRIA
ncbi:MAG: DUF3343 domain-containing protein [Clostridiales bacterium]|nr:DUF3343 domain-containing protein [Clostridiales bacterium]